MPTGPGPNWDRRVPQMKKGRVLGAIRPGAAIAVLICLAGCEAGGAGRASITTTRPADPTLGSTATATTFPTTNNPGRGFSTERVIVQGPGPDSPRASSLFKQVRFVAGDGFDQAVFEFEGLPWSSFYVEYPSEDEGLGDAGCSAPERVKGTDLVVSFHGTGTSSEPYPNDAPRSYTGAERIRPRNTPQILEAVFFCELEAIVEWVLVLRDQRPFRVTTLTDPPRIVIDVERRR
jgi:hypothetical protein